jgi:hypothetical protein
LACPQFQNVTHDLLMEAMKPQSPERLIATFVLSALFVAIAGCGPSSESSKRPSPQTGPQDAAANKPLLPPPPPPPPPAEAREPPSATPAVMEPLLYAWKQGDHASALRRFTETDWSARPLFAPASVLSLSESQFAAIPAFDREARANEMLKQVGVLQQLVRAVLQAAAESADKKHSAQARRYFTSLKQCGQALDEGDALAIVKQIAQMMKKRADEGLAKLGP